jgi:hypothetical protein
MVIYLCSRDIDVSSSPVLVNRKGAERGNIDISSTQIHDHSVCARDIDSSSFYTLSIDEARRENDHVFVC